MAFNTYCVLADLQNLLSVDGVNLRSDDAPPTVLGDVIDMASDEIEWYLYDRYKPTALVGNDTVTKFAAVIAAYNLCERRGNPVPVGIDQKYTRTLEKLKQVQAGQYRIPGVPQRKGYIPVMSNMRATQRPYPRAVVERSRSTGTPENYSQNRDPWDAVGMNADAYLNWVI